jgi:Uma2 family endonuclease
MSMGVQTAISMDDYLQTSFPDLDKEYRDGELVERSMPDYLHGKIQLKLGVFFMALSPRLALYPSSEARLLLSSRRALIPDVAVFHLEEPQGIPTTPPLVAIEILSPDDRLTEVREKLREYHAWGVPHVWLVDPRSRVFYTCQDRLREVITLTIPELGVELTQADLFD